MSDDTVSREAYNDAVWRYERMQRALWKLQREYDELSKENSELENNNVRLASRVKDLEKRGMYSCIQEQQMNRENEAINAVVDALDTSPIRDEMIGYLLEALGVEANDAE